MIGSWRKKLRQFIEHRKELDNKIEALTAAREHWNWKILQLMQKHSKAEIDLSGWHTQVITPRSISLEEKKILRWYERHKMKPPIKKVFDTERFEQDINDGRVPASVLKAFSRVEDKKPYVRISKLGGRDGESTTR